MDTAATLAEAFYTEVLDSYQVWTLRGEDGIFLPLNEPSGRTLPFWSTADRAEKITAAAADYEGFTVARIPLVCWLEQWVPGFTASAMRVALNWDGSDPAAFVRDPEVAARDIRDREPAWLGGNKPDDPGARPARRRFSALRRR